LGEQKNQNSFCLVAKSSSFNLCQSFRREQSMVSSFKSTIKTPLAIPRIRPWIDIHVGRQFAQVICIFVYSHPLQEFERDWILKNSQESLLPYF